MYTSNLTIRLVIHYKYNQVRIIDPLISLNPFLLQVKTLLKELVQTSAEIGMLSLSHLFRSQLMYMWLCNCIVIVYL